ncbi:MAG: N-formylglutamate deformylase, partial [Lysobacterales bacterium]
HDGTAVPDYIARRLTDSARRVPDTDWHIARLYAFARELGASMIVPKYSRYVVDLNRSEDDVALYYGQNTTGLCPLLQFNGEPVYREDQQPTPEEIAKRVEIYWRPYHQALRDELDRLQTSHGRVLLWEGHSIKDELSFLFDGRLPDLNLGTVDGTSCSQELQSRIESALVAQSAYGYVVNGRFKGGHITREYGDPSQGIEAVQLEISQRIYMDQDAFVYDPVAARKAQATLAAILTSAL